LGQLVSDFVHKRNALLQQQRAEILNAIHDCHAKTKSASQEDKKQIHEECKAKIKDLREKYKEQRKQLQGEFKELKATFKGQINIEKIKHENSTRNDNDDEKESKHFDNSTGNLAKEIKKFNQELKKSKGKSEEHKKGHNQEDD